MDVAFSSSVSRRDSPLSAPPTDNWARSNTTGNAEMAAMYHQVPLQALNRPDSYCNRSYRSAINAKRKSAVELLEETKCLYVKSGNVLDSKQDLGKVTQQQVVALPHSHHHHHHHQLRSDHTFSAPSQPLPQQISNVPMTADYLRGVALWAKFRTLSILHPAPEEKCPPLVLFLSPIFPRPPVGCARTAAPPQRRTNNSIGSSDQLQTKLRRLLNADSKENLAAEVDQIETSGKKPGSRSCHSCRSLPDLSSAFGKERSTYVIYTPSSSKKASSSTHEDMSISKSGNSHESRTESDSSSDKSYGQPPSPVKSSVSFGGSASKAEVRRKRTVEWEGVKVGRMVRSKSDVGGCAVASTGALGPAFGQQPAPAPAPPLCAQPLPQHLNDFFQYLGLTSAQYSSTFEKLSVRGSPIV
ncbi:hypothetical protein AAG570_007097 [Ranatra chinensis]|uniref:Centrosome-associated FAM110 N-terminal domain-containing protein n=1 Tax=Ranatra chinensis TaxID=642074 RepID=A0ABD0XUV6_9HEMI